MPVSDYTPSLADVGSRIRRRTVDKYGQQTGTFRDATEEDPRRETTPTAAQVAPLISDAVDEVAAAVGADLPDGPAGSEGIYRDQAKKLAALYAAMLVELEYFGEEVASSHGSTYPQLKELWDASRKRLIESINEATGGTGTGGESIGSDNVGNAHYGFPPPSTNWDRRRF